jgi:hypothetical protein
LRFLVDSFLPFLLVGVFIAIAAVLAFFSYQQRQQRLAEMIALGQQLGWHFDPGCDTSHDALYAQFEVFRRGHSRYAYNTLQGSLTIDGEPCQVRMGDYHYRVTSGSGKSRRTRTYEMSYLIVHLPYLRFPSLFIRREGVFDALAGAFGFDDIDFESAEFSKQFHVKSDDKRFAYDVIHPAMMDFLMGEEPPVVDIESGKGCLTDGVRKWSSQEFCARLNWAERFFKLWPRHLVATLKSV